MKPAIEIKNLSKHYKNFCALDQVTFNVEAGEFFGFLGPNGAGKTTTIGAMTGLINYTEGSIHIFGHDVTREYRNSRCEIGLVPQEFNFDPFLSAEQILMFEGGYFGLTRREAKIRAEELLKIFSLWDKRKGGYKKMSGGMKRRLLIARALMHKPRILILDEPTAGVDLELRYHLWDFLRKLNREGTTIFLTTHYIEEAEQLCNRIGVIHEGKMVATKSTKELISQMNTSEIQIKTETKLGNRLQSIQRVHGDAFLSDDGCVLHIQEESLTAVLKALLDEGIKISQVKTKKATLEDAFLKLIQKDEK